MITREENSEQGIVYHVNLLTCFFMFGSESSDDSLRVLSIEEDNQEQWMGELVCKETKENKDLPHVLNLLNIINQFEPIRTHNSPLTIAIEKALLDAQYLPLVKHALCSGHLPKFNKKLIKKSKVSFFDTQEDMKKPIRQLIKSASLFYDFVQNCIKNDDTLITAQTMLLAVAKRDRVFFNELVQSLFQEENGELFTHSDDKNRCVNVLFDFANKHLRAFNADTLVRIADNLQKNDDLVRARQFYEMAIILSDDYGEILNKLHVIDKRIESPLLNIKF
jgi:hypothetical protein